MATRMQQRRATAAQWTSVNPVLAAGEIGFETDTNKFKIGNNVNAWDALDYFSTSVDLSAYATEAYADQAEADAITSSNNYTDTAIANLVDSAPGALDTLNELAAALGDDANFATTVTNSLAGKSDTGHSHVISDITSLQSELDSKVDQNNPTANLQTESGTTYTITSSDAGKTIIFDSASDIIITVNDSTGFNAGERVDIIQDGAGIITITASTATVAGNAVSTTTGDFTIGDQYSAATILCVATDNYRLIGNITAVA